MSLFYWISNRFRGVLNISYLLRANRKAFKSNDIFILPHLGYGDLICCIPIFLEYAEAGKRLQVFSPTNAIPLLQKSCAHKNISFLPIEECLSEAEFAGELMIHRAGRFARKHSTPILFLGYDLLWLLSKIRPDLDIDTVFYRLAKVPLSSFKKYNIGAILRNSNDQFPLPFGRYALVDHFPGSDREIDPNTIAMIEAKGLEIVLNPREVKYENLIDLIENAAELHFVNSSLLCLSLLLNNRAERKVVYPINKKFYPGLYFYDHSWEEFALSSIGGEKYTQPSQIDRPAEHELLIKQSRRLHNKLLDKIIFRSYPNPF